MTVADLWALLGQMMALGDGELPVYVWDDWNAFLLRAGDVSIEEGCGPPGERSRAVLIEVQQW